MVQAARVFNRRQHGGDLGSESPCTYAYFHAFPGRELLHRADRDPPRAGRQGVASTQDGEGGEGLERRAAAPEARTTAVEHPRHRRRQATAQGGQLSPRPGEDRLGVMEGEPPMLLLEARSALGEAAPESRLQTPTQRAESLLPRGDQEPRIAEPLPQP